MVSMSKQFLFGVIVFSVMALFVPNSVSANNAGHHHWQSSPHHLSALTGTTYTDEHGHAFTFGIDYEYRINDFLGVGVVAEYAFEDLDAYTYLLVADLHITPKFIAQVGPGVEFHGGDKIAVGRLGLLYEFEINNFTVSPQLHYDYHHDHEDAVVAGVAVGFSF